MYAILSLLIAYLMPWPATHVVSCAAEVLKYLCMFPISPRHQMLQSWLQLSALLQMMAMAAGPLTPLKDRGEGADGEGGSGDDQQDKGQTWEGTEPLGGTAAGCSSPQHWFLHKQVQYLMSFHVCSVIILALRVCSCHHTCLAGGVVNDAPYKAC